MEANKERTDAAYTSPVLALLREKIPENTALLTAMLREAEACYISTVEARIKAQAQLHTERERLRHPKDKEYTDWDRKIMLDAGTSELQATYELHAGTEKALEQRMVVIRALLTC